MADEISVAEIALNVYVKNCPVVIRSVSYPPTQPRISRALIVMPIAVINFMNLTSLKVCFSIFIFNFSFVNKIFIKKTFAPTPAGKQ